MRKNNVGLPSGSPGTEIIVMMQFCPYKHCPPQQILISIILGYCLYSQNMIFAYVQCSSSHIRNDFKFVLGHLCWLARKLLQIQSSKFMSMQCTLSSSILHITTLLLVNSNSFKCVHLRPTCIFSHQSEAVCLAGSQTSKTSAHQHAITTTRL